MTSLTLMCKDSKFWDFSGGPVVKTPPFKAGVAGWIPGWGTKIPRALGYGQKIKSK